MGIRGLKRYLDTKYVSKNVDWKEFENKKIGIDIQPFIYKAKAEGMKPIEVICNFLLQANEKKIKVIFVFDGKPPKEKSALVKERIEERKIATSTIEHISADISAGIVPDKDLAVATIKHLKSSIPIVKYDDIKELKKLFYTLGIEYYQAAGEADYFLAYLSNNNLVDGVCSPDMDFLARNINNLIVPSTNILSLDTDWSVYNLETILRKLNFTYEQFVLFCVLIGCDYTYPIPSIPHRTAFDAIRVYKTFSECISALKIKTDYIETLINGCELLVYNEKEISELIGMSSIERFTSSEKSVPEYEYIDNLSVSNEMKDCLKVVFKV
jgi:flap endonuclease-1